MAPGWMQILIVAIVALLLFGGRGRISSIMGDVAKGITSFRKGLKDDDQTKSVDAEEMVNITPETEKAKSTDQG